MRSAFPALLLTLAITSALPTRLASAHGGTPYSLRLMRQQGTKTLYMPAYWWGLWVGSVDASTDPAAPWHFICEEAINAYHDRRFSLSVDGALYATNSKGITVARKNGCEWLTTDASSGGDLATLASTDVAPDPTDGASAWVTTGTNASVDGSGVRTPAANGLFVTHDHGDHWARLGNLGAKGDPTYGRTFDSVEVAPTDGKTLYVTSTDYAPPFGVQLHQSTDSGTTFATAGAITIAGRGALFSLQLLAIDPRDAQVFYARATLSGADPMQLFVRGVWSAGDVTLTELWSIAVPSANSSEWSKGINDVSFDLAHDQILVATGKGLVRGSAALASAKSTFVAGDNLAQTQCVTYDAESGRLFACGGTFGPDFAALACDSATSSTLKSIFAFTDTLGPIDCPADTGVAKICPAIWNGYRGELFPNGVGDDGGANTPVDAGSDGGSPSDDSGCSVSGAHGTSPWAALLLLAMFVFVRATAPAAATQRHRGTRRR